MPYTIDWLVEGRVIYIKGYGEVTVEELVEIADITFAMADNGIAPVHIIADDHAVTAHPKNVRSLRILLRPPHPKVGWTATVMTNFGFRIVLDLFMQLQRAHHRNFNTVDDARDFLNRVDADLPDLLALPLPGDVVGA